MLCVRSSWPSTFRFAPILTIVLGIGIANCSLSIGQDRLTKVRNDKSKIAEAGEWIYNDLPAAQAKAQAERKPLLVVLRCIP